jgi:hypothetical protein
MTKDDMEIQADSVMATGLAALELNEDWSPVFSVHTPGEGWHDYHLPPGTEHMLNIGEAKDAIFGWFRDLVQRDGCDSLLFSTDAWKAVATEEGMKHKDEYKANMDRGFKKLLKLGWVTRVEVFMVVIQTATDVLMASQMYSRLSRAKIELVGPVERDWTTQDDFRGRQKMFGDLRKENLS